ncbi:MAG: restriction endonuclease subunit S [Methanosarcina sp.]|jgi:type I restriction enzyme S subunit
MKTIKSLTEAELSRLPKGWYWTKLENIANFKNGINFTKSQRGDIGILTLDVFNMYSKNIFPKLENLYRVNITPKEEYILKNGDILFVRSSVKREGVGWTTIFREIGEQVTFCGFIIRGRLVTSDVFPKYLAYHLRAASARKNIIDSSSQVTITNINQNSLGAIPVPLPPLPEQRAIVSKIELLFSELDNGIANLKLAQEQLKVYRQAVLKKAFEGELTRKWREQQTDLPDAGDLLEKIRKEKEEAAKVSGRRLSKVAPPTDTELAELPKLPAGWRWAGLGEIIDNIQAGKSIRCDERPPKLRAYPKSPAALNVIHAHAKCSIAR